MINRNLIVQLSNALADTPVIFLAGARQTGKTTLVQQISRSQHAEYFTFDDLSIQSAAAANPQGFIAGLPSCAIIDEVQRVPNVFTAIKYEVDKNRRPGRFILTGSANVLTIPRMAESLAGRIEVHTLRPFSQGELISRKETFIDAVFSGSLEHRSAGGVSDLIDRITKGGYPEVVQRPAAERRSAWFRNYVATILQRDIKDLADIDGLTQIPDLLKMIAARCANLLNFADIARSLQLPQTSLKRYISLLESIFLTYRLLPWHVNLNSRLTKSPKIYLEDTGLACHLLGISDARLEQDRQLLGQLLECFVVNELRKQNEWSETRPSMYHFRTHTGQEVDCILENAAGSCVGIEIKAAQNVSAGDAKGLVFLKQALKRKFHRGIVLYNGDAMIPFEENIHAVPLSAVWEW